MKKNDRFPKCECGSGSLRGEIGIKPERRENANHLKPTNVALTPGEQFSDVTWRHEPLPRTPPEGPLRGIPGTQLAHLIRPTYAPGNSTLDKLVKELQKAVEERKELLEQRGDRFVSLRYVGVWAECIAWWVAYGMEPFYGVYSVIQVFCNRMCSHWQRNDPETFNSILKDYGISPERASRAMPGAACDLVCRLLLTHERATLQSFGRWLCMYQRF